MANWSEIVGQLGNAGATGYGIYASGKASKQQQEATDKALELQRQVLALQQQNQMPYMQTGNAALMRLNALLTPQGQTPAQVNGPNGADQGGSMMLVTAPNGQTMWRPTSEMDHWRGLGATIGNAVTRPGGGNGAMGVNGSIPALQSSGSTAGGSKTKGALGAASTWFLSNPQKTTDLLKRLFGHDKSKQPATGSGGGGGVDDTNVVGRSGRDLFGNGLDQPQPPGPGIDQRGSCEWCALNPNDPRCAWLGQGAGIPPQEFIGGQ